MAKGSRRGGRVRDKWRDKQWIIVNAPSAFENVPLNYIPISDLNTAKGRVIENTLFDVLKQDPTQHQTKIFVQIDKINSGIATTIFKGHEYAKEFLRSLIRRGSSMINFVHEYTTSDGYVFRVSTTAFSQKRINSAKKHEMRLAMHKVLSDKIPSLSLDDFVKEATMGNMNSELMEITKKIANIRHVGIRKTKLISSPLKTLEEVSDVDATVDIDEDINVDTSTDLTRSNSLDEVDVSSQSDLTENNEPLEISEKEENR